MAFDRMPTKAMLSPGYERLAHRPASRIPNAAASSGTGAPRRYRRRPPTPLRSGSARSRPVTGPDPAEADGGEVRQRATGRGRGAGRRRCRGSARGVHRAVTVGGGALLRGRRAGCPVRTDQACSTGAWPRAVGWTPWSPPSRRDRAERVAPGVGHVLDVVRLHERVDDHRIELDAGELAQLAEGLLCGQRRHPVGAGGGHRLERVGDVEDAGQSGISSPISRSGYPEPLYHS